MSRRYLLDTNALAEPVKPRPNAAFLAQLAANQHFCAIAAVTWHEALFGVERMTEGARRASLYRYMHQVVAPTLPVLAYDTAAATWHAQIRAQRERIGRPLSFADGQIAAIAHVNGLTVVTANVSDFDGLDGVDVVNWMG